MSTSAFDLLIIGGGPAGLGAAIAGASEGLNTLVLENDQFGGQANGSTNIENYAGFPNGVSGSELTGNMVMQARRLGANLRLATITHLERDGDRLVAIGDEEDDVYYANAVLLAMGVQYRRLRADNLDAYIGWGARYGSPDIHTAYANEDIYVVGGANSAGQAAVHLANCHGCNVHLVVRAGSLEKGMSSYLIKKIRDMENIHVHLNTEVTAVDGNRKVETLWLTENGVMREVPAHRLFVMIGAIPKTQWLNGTVERDPKGFLLVGTDLPEATRQHFLEDCGRPPLADETCNRGVFAIGDVRSGTFKRVSASVASGQTTVASILRYREQLGL